MRLRTILSVCAIALGTVIAFGANSLVAAERVLTDQAITDQIEDELQSDQAISAAKIDVSASAGIVTLGGSVGSILAKDRAVRIVKTVKGVKSVIDKLSVNGAERSDKAIEQDVENALLQDPATESYEVKAEAVDGVVTLRGVVESNAERELAAKVAKSVDGVRGLTSHVQVEYQIDRSDGQIYEDIEQALRWDALVDSSDIDIKVADGKVTLYGMVDSAIEKSRDSFNAWVTSVRDVDASNLEVREGMAKSKRRKIRYRVKSDQELRKAVEAALYRDPRVNAFNLTPEVDSGFVTLRGIVSNLKAKRAAAQTARNTWGVVRVENRLKVRPAGEVTDVELASRMESALRRDPLINRHEITVLVDNGVARLYGTVDSHFEKAQADDLASRILGVVEVRNHLGVDYVNEPYAFDPYVDEWSPLEHDYWHDYEPPRYAARSDQEIESAIKDEMWWSPFVDEHEVKIEVEDGVAVLTGMVDSQSERSSAVENAYEGGATWVVNHLAIRE